MYLSKDHNLFISLIGPAVNFKYLVCVLEVVAGTGFAATHEHVNFRICKAQHSQGGQQKSGERVELSVCQRKLDFILEYVV